jgi:hypothetical protein
VSGIYGLVAYRSSRHARIGIRVALGARKDVTRLLVGQGLASRSSASASDRAVRGRQPALGSVLYHTEGLDLYAIAAGLFDGDPGVIAGRKAATIDPMNPTTRLSRVLLADAEHEIDRLVSQWRWGRISPPTENDRETNYPPTSVRRRPISQTGVFQTTLFGPVIADTAFFQIDSSAILHRGSIGRPQMSGQKLRRRSQRHCGRSQLGGEP